MKKIMISFLLILILYITYASYCGSSSIQLTDDTPITIVVRDCSDPDAFAEIYNISGIVSSETVGNRRSCARSALQFCAVGYSNTSDYVNITLTRFEDGSEDTITNTITFLNKPIIPDNNETDVFCFDTNIIPSIGDVWVLQANSSYYDEDGDLISSDISEVNATIIDCHDPDDCYLNITINSTTCFCDEIIYKVKITRTRDGSTGGTSANISFNESFVGESNSRGWFEFSKPAITGRYEIEAKKSGCDSDSVVSYIDDEFIEGCAPCDSRYLNYNITNVSCGPPMCIANLTFNVWDTETEEPVEGIFVNIEGIDGSYSNYTNTEGQTHIFNFPYMFNVLDGFIIYAPDDHAGGYANIIFGNITISSDESSEDSCHMPCTPYSCQEDGFVGCDPSCAYGELGPNCCCNYCHPDFVCVECFEEGISCTNNSQCCDIDCIDGVCTYCEPTLPCSSDEDCCGGTCGDDEKCYGCVGPECEEEPDDDSDDGIIPPPSGNESIIDSILWLWNDGPLIGGEYDDDFFNFNFSLRSGCTGLFIVIDNWIFCDLLWLLLLVLSLIVAYKYRIYPLRIKMSVIVFIIPMIIGFLTYVWIGIIIAILEILLIYINPPKKEKKVIK